jgi:hypothetical protein
MVITRGPLNIRKVLDGDLGKSSQDGGLGKSERRVNIDFHGTNPSDEI